LIITWGILFLGLMIPAFAESVLPKKSRIEAFLYLSWNSGAGAAIYRHDYPLAFADALPGAHGFQQLNIEPKWGEGIQGGLCFFLTDSFGLKLSFIYSRHKLGGVNSPYGIQMNYTTRMPPDYKEIEITHNSSTEWMATEGRLESLAFSLNAQFRFPLSRIATGMVSVGPGILCAFGRFSALGYSEYWLGGHGVLFSDTSLLMMNLPAAWKTCLNADCEISFHLSKLLSLAARVAYIATRSMSMIPSIDRIFSYYSLDEVDTETYVNIKNYLNFKPFELNPSAVSLSLGLKVQL
jgi:hypothetical protein